MAATADVISEGRFELFVSHGLREREHTSYGFPWEPDVDRRIGRLAEVDEAVCWYMDWPVGNSLRSSAEDVRPMLDFA